MKKYYILFLAFTLFYININAQVLKVENGQRDYWGNSHEHIIEQAHLFIMHHLGYSYVDIANYLLEIKIGDIDEDEFDPVYGYGGLLNWNVTNTHFWDADISDDQTNYWPFHNYPNAYTKVQKYIHGNYDLHMSDDHNPPISHKFQYPDRNGNFGLIDFYKTGYVNCAYHGWETHNVHTRTVIALKLLGHMCHLLQDMSVPIHSHVFMHPRECYEEYVGFNGLPNYQTAGSFKNPFNSYYGSDPIRGLFYTANQMADLFPSNNQGEAGNCINPNIPGDNSFSAGGISILNEYYASIFPTPPGYYQNFNLSQQGYHLGNYSISATASLLYWFATLADLTKIYPPVISSITTNMIGDQTIGYTLFNGQTGFLYSTTQGTNITRRWNYFECDNNYWGTWPFDIANVKSHTPQYNPHFGAFNDNFTGASCSIDNSLPVAKYLRAQLFVSNAIGSVLSAEYKIIPSVLFGGGGCPYIFVLGNDTSGGKYFTENNILHHSEFTENVNQSITDVYKLKTVPKIDSNKITIQIMETENDVNYFDQIKLFAVDHPVGSKIGITESNDIVMYYPNDVSSSDFATQNFSANNIAPYIQYGQPAPKITGIGNDFVNSHYDSTSQYSKLKSYKNRLKSKGNRTIPDSLALIGEIGSDAFVEPIIAKDWAGSISIYTNSDTYVKPFSKRVNVSDVIIPFAQTSDIVDHVDINFNSDYAMSYFSVVPVSYEGFTKTELSLISAVHALNGDILSTLASIDNNFAIMDTTAIIDLKFGSINPPDPTMVRDYVFVVNGKYTSDIGSDKSQLLRTTTNNNLKPENIAYKYKLNVNYPNPFNPKTKISYSLAKAGNTKLMVYDILGRLVNVIVNEYKSAGEYTVEFNGSHLSSGVYIYRLESNDFIDSKRMLMIK